jgi:Bacterial archaeo-eukaryotic release factor family 10
VSLGWATLRSLAGMTDEIGILSIYVTLDPHYRVEAGVRPPWELRMRHQLGQLPDRLKERGPREHWKALTRRLDQLQPELVRLLGPTTTGQGRALFAGIADGEVRTAALQVPLGDRVVLEPDPYLRPLLAAWSTAGPAGAVSVSADEVRVVDMRFGLAEVVGTIRYESGVEQRELKGPAATGSGFFQRSAPQHDLFERREDDKLARHLRTVGPRLAGFVTDREWSYLALTGDTPLVQALRDGLPAQLPAEVVTLDHPVNSLPPARLAATVAPALDEARHRRHRELAEQARDKAMSANAGACGLSETLGALQEGRVAHLLLDAGRQWSGSRTADGVLVPDGEVPPGVDAAALRPEPHLGERMIELAFRDGARVTMLAPQAAAPLSDADGIGAILRW